MKQTRGSLNKHCQMQQWLVTTLKQKGYTRIYENLEYHVLDPDLNWINGELDILASRDGVTWNYYEIKSGFNCLKKAKEQYARARVAVDGFPIREPVYRLRGIYVGPDKIKRLYSHS